MRIVVITSCTGEKSVEHKKALTLTDFKKGTAHVRKREKDLKAVLTPAEKLYTGQQHVRLMRGIEAFRQAHPTNGKGPALDLYILSAGYGLVPANKKLAPYEATFQGMKAKELRSWADQLKIPAQVRKVLSEDYDLAFVLLGDAYLTACSLDETVPLGGPTIVFCGTRAAKRLPSGANPTAVPLANADAKAYSCALVSLKGELAARLLELAATGGGLPLQLCSPSADGIRALLSSESAAPRAKGPRANPAVDVVIRPPKSWYQRPHRDRMQYFIPDWDDQVDPDFDFERDQHSGGSGDWSNQTYAHQMFPEPNYDGILVSKVVAEQGRKKKARINELGVHRFLRVPRSFPVMGDCGAFGYIKEDVPPFSTDEILDYYTRLDFDFGVSVDHLIVTATADDARSRYDLTIQNAEEFLKEHQARGLGWTPIGAVQGWDAKSYSDAAKKYVAMGYDYIALGGLVRTSTKALLPILQAVSEVVPEHVSIHLFGLARLNALGDFRRFGVRSVDSASYLRQAWMRTTTSYVLPDASYAALRIPEAGKSFRAKRMKDHPDLSEEKILRLEKEALSGVREYARGNAKLDHVLSSLLEYDQYVTAERVDMEPFYRRTLECRPWEQCGCAVCRDAGVEVAIFRGNNRNRRRGFHNTYVFYRLFADAISKADTAIPSPIQQDLPMPDAPGAQA